MNKSAARPQLLQQYERVYMPIVKAYVFAYLSATTPAVIGILVALIRKKRAARDALEKIASTLQKASSLDKFPACCAILVAGSVITPRLILGLLSTLTSTSKGRLKRLKNDSIFRWLGTFGSAIVAFDLLNRRPARPIPSGYGHVDLALYTAPAGSKANEARPRKRSSVSLGSSGSFQATGIPLLAGRTMDLTTFGAIHSIVIIASTMLYYIRKARLDPDALRASCPNIERNVAPAAFITSSFIIMWLWFFSPDRLPRNYTQWITSAAQIDGRLLEALRQVRYGHFVYGKETGLSELLGSMARERGYPETWGDPAKTVPIPCELYHASRGNNAGANCEWHAITRFTKAWTFALRMYLPLNLIMMLRRKPAQRQPVKALTEAAQSAAFLASFISLVYYSVCLGRTRIGPLIIGTSPHARNIIDGGVCEAVGCFACGWSILLEKASRRPEMALFVAPRALSAVLPRRYDKRYIWREQIVFAFSAATILTAAQKRPERVKGVFGRVLQSVFE